MKIILYSKHSFLEKEISKINDFTPITIIKDIDELYHLNIIDTKTILFQHLDYDDKNLIELLKDDFKNIRIVAFRNNTNNIEGCSILKKGYKAYAHSMSNFYIIENIIQTVQNGNTWIYPELMQFLCLSD